MSEDSRLRLKCRFDWSLSLDLSIFILRAKIQAKVYVHLALVIVLIMSLLVVSRNSKLLEVRLNDACDLCIDACLFFDVLGQELAFPVFVVLLM